MKKIYILFLILIISIFTGCNQDNQTKKEQEFQSEIITNHNTYQIDNYKKIKNIGIDFELALLDQHIDIKSISFETGQYANGEYKTIVYIINSDLDITLKFDKEGNLMLINIICTDKENSDYDNIKNAILNWEYFDFDFTEKNKAYTLDNDILKIDNFEIDSSSIGFSISDTQYIE